MRALYLLSNREKAAILFHLFPEEIPQLVTFIGELAAVEMEDSAMRQRWDHAVFSFDDYVGQVDEVAKAIDKVGNGINATAERFADELFGGHRALFSCHAAVQFVTVRLHPNHKFTQAINFLFKP